MGVFEDAVEEEIQKLRVRLDAVEDEAKRSHVLGGFLGDVNHWLEELDRCKDRVRGLIGEWEVLLLEIEEESEDFDFQEPEEVSEEESEWE